MTLPGPALPLASEEGTTLTRGLGGRQHGARAGVSQLLRRNVQRFRSRLVFKAHRRCVPLNSNGSNASVAGNMVHGRVWHDEWGGEVLEAGEQVFLFFFITLEPEVE